MASLISPRMRFLHVPKTGGTWATAAMLASGVRADRPGGMPFHANLAESAAHAGRFTVAFVRHPLEFWRSYWCYRMRTGWNPAHHWDACAGSEDFGEFIERITIYAAGGASALYEEFVGAPDRQISFLGRHERLADDLCRALHLAGEPFDEQRLRAHPPENVSDYGELPAIYTRSAAERLAECEAPAIERFYPWDPVPDRFLASPRPVVTSEDRRLIAVAQ